MTLLLVLMALCACAADARVASAARWSLLAAPQLAKRFGYLSDVSCPAKNACAVAGDGGAASWNGRRWVVQPFAKALGPNEATAVSCSTPSACTVLVGANKAPGEFAERWNGARWLTEPMPTPRGVNFEFTRISCPSQNTCIALGSWEEDVTRANGSGSAFPVALVERWDGLRWSIQQMPGLTPSGAGELTDISCPAPNACIATGSKQAFSKTKLDLVGPVRTLMEFWDGSRWTIKYIRMRTVDAISCISPTSCTGVGQQGPPGHEVPLAEQWNGSRWSIQPTPPFPDMAMYGGLGDVSCTSRIACTAVGEVTSHSDEITRTLAEHWDGSSWTIQSTPNPLFQYEEEGPFGVDLGAISCSSATACIAIGNRPPQQAPFLERLS